MFTKYRINDLIPELRDEIYQTPTALSLLSLQKTTKFFSEDKLLKERIKITLKIKSVVRKNTMVFILYNDGTVFYVENLEKPIFIQLPGLSEPIEKIINGPGNIAFIGSTKIYTTSSLLTDQSWVQILAPSDLSFLSGKPFDLNITHNRFHYCLADSVYSFGVNEYGELGYANEDEHESESETKPKEILSLSGKFTKAIATTETTTYFICNDGLRDEVYVCGLKRDIGLGRGHGYADEKEQSCIPTMLPGIEDDVIKKIVASDYNNFTFLFIIASRKVYACGKNNKGQLGLGHNVDTLVPTSILALEDKGVEDIFILDDNISFYARCDDGAVYVWGKNTYNQLGLGHTNPVNIPTKLEFLAKEKVLNIIRNGSLFFICKDKFFTLSLDKETRQLKFLPSIKIGTKEVQGIIVLETDFKLLNFLKTFEFNPSTNGGWSWNKPFEEYFICKEGFYFQQSGELKPAPNPYLSLIEKKLLAMDPKPSGFLDNLSFFKKPSAPSLKFESFESEKINGITLEDRRY